jgi:hypothetical protein
MSKLRTYLSQGGYFTCGNRTVTITQLPGQCGMRYLAGMSDGAGMGSMTDAEKFIKLCAEYAKSYSKDAKHLCVCFTHHAGTPIEKMCKDTPGIVIVHKWKNSNTGHSLFLAVVSPKDAADGGKKTSPARKASKRVAID